MKYNVKFIDEVEGRDTITHGGVSFPIGEAVQIDSDEVEMSPWFEGNPSFQIEEIEAGKPAIEAKTDEAAVEAKPPVKRVRKKVAGE